MANVEDVIKMMEYIAPSWMAYDSDTNGLQAGSRSSKVKKVLLALDATEKTIDYAVKNKFQMIVTHHPRFFRPLSSVCRDTFLGNIAYKLCKNDIALFNAHTNFDVAPGGINDILADIVGIDYRVPVDPLIRDDILKLSVYVNEDHVEELREALCEAGAGEIGNYSECSHRTLGLMNFKPQFGAKPYIGDIGELHEGEEWKLELVLPQSLKKGIEKVLLQVHPYEEPAYDFVKIQSFNSYGLGRVGDLNRSTSLTALAKKLKKETASKAVQVLESNDSPVLRVAVWSGSGADISKVIKSGADCLVCGELGYHYAEELEYYNISAIVLGHCPCEEIALNSLKYNLEYSIENIDIEVAPRFSPDFVSV